MQREERHAIVFYDGTCGFCSRVVQFIIPRDPAGVFRFAAIQSEAGQRLLSGFGMDTNELDTFVLLDDSQLYTRSTAALRVIRRLNGAWPLLYAFIVVPAVLRDTVYRYVARNRYRWFGRTDACMLPDRSVRDRFLVD